MPGLTESLNNLSECIKKLFLSTSSVQFENFVLEKFQENHLVTGIVSDAQPCIVASLYFESTHTNCENVEVISSSVDQSGVIGSPLKLHDFLGDMKLNAVVVECHERQISMKPVSVSQARRLLSLYNLAYQQQTKQPTAKDGETVDSWPALWVLCDGQDSRHIALMSTSFRKPHKSDTSKRLLGVNDSNMNVTKGCENGSATGLYIVAGHCVSESGPLTDQCKALRIESLIQEQFFKRQHKVNYIAKYDLISQLTHDRTFGVGPHSASSSEIVGRHGSVEATLQWDRHCNLLDEPPLDASALLLISPVSGDPRSAASNMFSDLCTLQGFTSGLNEGLVKWSVVDADVPLIDRVKCLIEDQKLGDMMRPNSKQSHTSLTDDGNMPLKQLPERQDLDFTEHLWNILKDCSSYADLIDCLQYVVDTLHHGNLQPMVHRQNKTKLGEMIRSSYYGQLDQSALSSQNPLNLIIEVGIEKLFRDYTHAFLAKDLVTMSHLRVFLSAEADTAFGTRIDRLMKLHQVIEMVVMLEQYLGLPRTVLSTAARLALKYYESHELSTEDTFTMPIQTVVISQLFKDCRPKIWKVEYVTPAGQCGEIHASVVLTLTPTFPHLGLSLSADVSEHENKRFAGYFVTVASEQAAVV